MRARPGSPTPADRSPLRRSLRASTSSLFPARTPRSARLIASGLPTEQFTFHGFLPAKAGQRKTALEELARGEVTHVFYEAPHRILDTLADVEAVFGAAQHVVIARELTKLHEEFLRGPVSELRRNLPRAPAFAARSC